MVYFEETSPNSFKIERLLETAEMKILRKVIDMGQN